MAKVMCVHIDFVWYESRQKLYHCSVDKAHSCCGYVPYCKHAEVDLFPQKDYPVLLPGKELSRRLGYK